MSGLVGNPLLLLTAAGAGGPYEIPRSVRFNSADSAYLSRTPASTSNRRTWTWSGWLKKVKLTNGLFECMFGVSGATDPYLRFQFLDGNQIFFEEYDGVSITSELRSTATYRDTSAWYHILAAVDTTQATDSNRIKLYVNGVQITSFSVATYPSQNKELIVNSTVRHDIGNMGVTYSTRYFNGYLADIHFIDGQALDPTSFGEFDDNNVWQPIAYSGSYGTNGFHLDFADNSSAAALGYDAAGSNDWTVNNIAVGVTISSIGYGRDITFSSGTFKGTEYPWLAFDNSLTTAVASSVDGATVTWTPSTTVTASSSFSILVYDFAGAAVTLNGSSLSQGAAGPGGTQAHYYNYSGSFPVTVSTVTVRTTGGAASRFYAVLVDGNLVLDPGFANIGDDSLVDSPTNGTQTDTGVGGEVVGNYATLNPLSTTAGTYTQGNLRYVGASSWRRSNGTIAVTTGKWYWEVSLGNAPNTPRNSTSEFNAFGFGLSTTFNSTAVPSALTDAVIMTDSGYYKNFGGAYTDGGTAFLSVDVLSIAVDLDANTFTFRRNNTQIATGTIGGTAGRELVPVIISYNANYGVMDANFGQRAFAYTAPSGFKALCTANLPTPTIEDGSTAMDVVTYPGTGIALTPTGSLNFSPDLIWIKSRSAATDHALYDIVRGTQTRLESNTQEAEVTSDGGVTAFNSNGFTLGTLAQVNTNAATYVSWCWDGGTSTVTNTDGTMTASVRANTSAGISIIDFNATNGTVGHGLGVAPGFFIYKYRAGTSNWTVYHQSLGGTQRLLLNTSDAATTSSTYWNNTPPSSSVITLGSNFSGIGSSIIYAFAPVSGFSSFGSYTGNGSADGPFVYTGFRPRWILLKSTGATYFMMYDTSRSAYNVTETALYPGLTNADTTESNNRVDILSNGFKVRAAGASNPNINPSAGTVVFAAFAENPFSLARAR